MWMMELMTEKEEWKRERRYLENGCNVASERSMKDIGINLEVK